DARKLRARVVDRRQTHLARVVERIVADIGERLKRRRGRVATRFVARRLVGRLDGAQRTTLASEVSRPELNDFSVGVLAEGEKVAIGENAHGWVSLGERG